MKAQYLKHKILLNIFFQVVKGSIISVCFLLYHLHWQHYLIMQEGAGGGIVGEGNLVNCIKGFGVLSWMRSDEGKVTWGSGVRWGGGLW